MSEPTSLNAKVSIPGKPGSGRFHRLLTYETVCEYIKLQGFDDYTTNALIEMAGRYPTQALPSFQKNFNLMIARVRAKRKQEQNGINNQLEKESQHGSQEEDQSQV